MRLLLNDAERRVLAQVEHRARDSQVDLARELKMSVRSFRYRLEGLLRRGVIREMRPFLNPSAAGLTDYTLFVSLSSRSTKDFSSLADACRNSPDVTWFARCGGLYDLCITIMAENPIKAHRTFNKVITQAKVETRTHDLVTRLRFHSLGRRFLTAGVVKGKELIARADSSTVSLDKVDFSILQFILRRPWRTIRDIARGVGLPVATLDRRLRRLEQSGVIVGYRYILNLHHFGASIYKVLVLLGRHEQSSIEILERIAHSTPVVSSFCQSFGSWDFEFNLETPNAADIPALVQTLYDQLGERLQDTRVLPLFEFFKSGSFPNRVEGA